MLIWLLNTIFSIMNTLLTVLLWALPVYFVLRMVIPGNKYLLLMAKYINMALVPVRKIVSNFAPRILSLSIDYSPMLLWVAVFVLRILLKFLRVVLL